MYYFTHTGAVRFYSDRSWEVLRGFSYELLVMDNFLLRQCTILPRQELGGSSKEFLVAGDLINNIYRQPGLGNVQ